MIPIFMVKSVFLIFVLALVIDIGRAQPSLSDIFQALADHHSEYLSGNVEWPSMTPQELAGACNGAEDDKKEEQFIVLQVLACRFVKHYLNGKVTEIPFNKEDMKEAKEDAVDFRRSLFVIFEKMKAHKKEKMMEVLKDCGPLTDGIKDSKVFYTFVSDCHKVLLYPKNKPVAWIMSCDIIKTYGPKLGAPEDIRKLFNWP